MPGELLVTEMVMLTHHLISLTMLIRMHWMHRDIAQAQLVRITFQW